MQLLRPIFALAMTAAIVSGAHAHEYKAGALNIGHPYARATVPNQPAGVAYLSIENKGTEADKFIGGSTSIARSVQVHTMAMDGNVMKMREVSSVEVKPSEKLVMQPGDGYHIMLIGLKQPLKAGDKFPLTLKFEKAGAVEVSVHVEDQSRNDGKGASEKGKDMAAQHHQH